MGNELSPLELATLQILKAFTKRERSAEVGFEDFMTFLERYVQHYRDRYRQLEVFSGDMRVKSIRALRGIQESGHCKLHSMGTNIERITFPPFFPEIVRDTFKKMEESPEVPFPNERGLGLAIPADMVMTTNVSTDLPGLIQGPEAESPLVRVLFPDNLQSILVTPDLVKSRLLDFSLSKLRYYLSLSNNAAYIQQRVVPAFSNNQVSVTEMMNTIVVKPATAKRSIEECSDFHFRFWAQLTNLVIQENRSSGNEAVLAGGTHQAAHLIAAYNLTYRSRTQKHQSDIKTTLQAVESQFRKAPFVYTLNDLYGLKGPSGLPLINKESQDAFLALLKERVAPPAGKAIPEILRLRTTDRKEQFIHREMVIPVFLRMIPDAAAQLDDHYVEAWSAALRNREKSAAMVNDEAFLRDLSKRLEYDHPLFHRLMNADLLNGVQRESKLSTKLSMDIARCFDRKSTHLKPTTELLDLDRKEILKRVKAGVPLWSRVGILRAIVGFFSSLFGSGRSSSRKATAPKTPQGSARKILGPSTENVPASAPETTESPSGTKTKRLTLKQSRGYDQRAVLALKEHFCGQAPLNDSLNRLSDQWNPLYEDKARQDLVEDVNSMVRSFMRGILRKGVKPPDAGRITSMTERLSQNPAFDRIRRKDLFKEYIQLYMIRILADQHGASV